MYYRFIKKIISISTALALTVSLAACAKEENTQTKLPVSEDPVYQVNLDAISPSAYSNVDGLSLEPGAYISIIGRSTGDSYWDTLEAGVKQAAADINTALGYSGSDKIKVTYNAPESSTDIDGQVNILDEELSRYPDVIGFASVDADACAVQFDLATESDIPVVSFDSSNNYDGILCVVKTDNIAAAGVVADNLSKEIKDAGTVLILANDSLSATSKDRVQGFHDELTANHPSVQVAETLYSDQMDEMKAAIIKEAMGDTAEADKAEGTDQAEQQASEETNSADQKASEDTGSADQEVSEDTNSADQKVSEDTENSDNAAGILKEIKDSNLTVSDLTDEDVIQYYLEKHPEVKAIYATNTPATQLAISACKQMDRMSATTIVGFDAGKTQLTSLKNGEISGLLVQNPFGMGYATVVACARTILEQGNEAVVNTGYVWVTNEDLENETLGNWLYE